MSKRKRPAHTEDELLEQWDFLDSMVERQAAQLRAGIQDSEEVDEPAAAVAGHDAVPRVELEALSDRLATLQREHEALAARAAALEADNRRLQEENHRLAAAHARLEERLAAVPKPPAPGGLSATEAEALRTRLAALGGERDRLAAEHAAVTERHRDEVARLHAEQERLQAQAAAAAREAAKVAVNADSNARTSAEAAALHRRIAELEASLARESSRHTELVESLRQAHGDLERLRAATLAEQSERRGGWWRRGR